MKVTSYIFFIVLFIKTITQRINEETFSLFFEKLFNNDITFKFVNFIEIIILSVKSSIFQKKNNDNLHL